MKEHNLVGKFSGRKLSEIQFDGKILITFRISFEGVCNNELTYDDI